MLIDLDTPAAVAGPPPARPRRVRYGAIVAALLLALIGGAAPPAYGAGLAPVADLGGRATTSFLLTGEVLYTAHPGEVVARPLRPGAPGWTTRVPADQSSITLAGTTVIVRPADAGPVTVLDARTGQIRWRFPADATALVLTDRVALWTAAAWPEDDGRLRMADLATGRTLWTRAAVPAGQLAADADHRFLAVAGAEGLAAVFAVADGRLLAESRDVGLDAAGFTATTVVDGRLFLFTGLEVYAYGLGDLKPHWMVRVGQLDHAQGCGLVICVSGPAGAAALDPVTGDVHWLDPRWWSLDPDGLVESGAGRVALVDPQTGQLRRDLGEGAVAGDLLIRAARDRTWVLRFGDGQVLGSLPRLAPRTCLRAGGFLACRTAEQAVTVWQIP